MSSIPVSNYLWNIICRNRKSILQLKSMHHTHHMYNIIWICNITQCHCSFLYYKQEQILKRAQICRFTQVKLTISLPTRTLSELFTVQCRQWEAMWNRQFIRKFQCRYINIQIPKTDIPPGQCARRESELSIFRYTWVKLTINPPPHPKYHSEPKAVHGIQLYILQNGQLIGIYKEIPVQINRQLSPLPPFKTARALSQLCTVQCCQWEPIWNGQLIGIYQEIQVQINWQLSPSL